MDSRTVKVKVRPSEIIKAYWHRNSEFSVVIEGELVEEPATARECCENCDDTCGGGATMLPLIRKCGNRDCPCHRSQENCDGCRDPKLLHTSYCRRSQAEKREYDCGCPIQVGVPLHKVSCNADAPKEPVPEPLDFNNGIDLTAMANKLNETLAYLRATRPKD